MLNKPPTCQKLNQNSNSDKKSEKHDNAVLNSRTGNEKKQEKWENVIWVGLNLKAVSFDQE